MAACSVVVVVVVAGSCGAYVSAVVVDGSSLVGDGGRGNGMSCRGVRGARCGRREAFRSSCSRDHCIWCGYRQIKNKKNTKERRKKYNFDPISYVHTVYTYETTCVNRPTHRMNMTDRKKKVKRKEGSQCEPGGGNDGRRGGCKNT